MDNQQTDSSLQFGAAEVETAQEIGRTGLLRFLPLLVLASSLLFTWLVWSNESHTLRQSEKEYFDFRANDAVAQTKSRLRLYQQALRGAQALFDVQGSVDRAEFRKYVTRLDLNDIYPGIQGIGYAQLIPPTRLRSHIAAIRREGFPEYAVKPAGKRKVYTSIVYLEPFDWRNRRAFGYDMYSEQVRRRAMERARDTGEMSMSGKVTLVQENGKDVQSGFLMYLPVYRSGRPHVTLQQRRANLVGWVYAVFRMGDLMHGIYGERANELDIHFYDGNDISAQSLMYDFNPDNVLPHGFNTTRKLYIAGHDWTMQVSSLPLMVSRFDTAGPRWTAAGGILVSLLLALVTWLVVNGRRSAIRLATRLNQSLIDSKKALASENAKNLALLHNASDGIHILDFDGNLIEVSDSFCAMLGYSRDELIGMNLSSWDVGADCDEEMCRIFRRQFDNPVRSQFETRHRRKDGSEFDVEVSGFPLELDGKPVLFNSSRDITERKQLQRKLQDEHDFSSAILQSAGPLILVIDRSGSIVRFNRAAEEFTGYRFDEVKERPYFWKNFLFEAQREQVERVFDSVFTERSVSTFENYWIGRGGEKRLFAWSNTLIFDEQGEGRFLIAIGSDITDSRKAEQMVQENEQRLLEILNLSPIAVRIAAKQGREVLFCNNSYVELIGNADAIGDDPRRYYARGEDYDEILGELRQGRAVINREVELRMPDGRVTWALSSYMPLEYGGEAAVLGWFYDITDRKHYMAQLQQSEHEYRHLIELLPYGVLIHREGVVLMANHAAASMLGADAPTELSGIETLQVVHPDFRDIVRARARVAIDEGESSELIEEKLVRLDGTVFDAEVAAIPVRYQNRPASLAVFVDISQRKKNEDDLRLAASVYRSSSEGMLITDADNRIVAINPAFTELTGYTEQEVLGVRPSILKSGLQSAEFYEDMWAQLKETGHWRGELWNRRKDGGIYAEQLTINAEKRGDGSIHRYVALFSDVTDQKRKEEQIWNYANYDALTGLPNRRLFYDRLEQESKKANRSGLSFALLFIDLDRFKEVNDTLGHAKGDLLLIEATRRIRKCIRDSDTLARLGGDEFTVILPEYGEALNIDRVVQGILAEMAQPFELGNGDLGHISGSIGITLYPEDSDNLDELLQYADQAMYAAKQAGRDGFSYFTASMQLEAHEKISLTNDLRQALAGDQLEVFYQPIVEAGSGNIVKAEALLRWRHPQLGMVGPDVFIPLAEESGLILEIGEWVFGQAIDNIDGWRQRTSQLVQVSVNKSPVQFMRAGNHLWHQRLEGSGLDGCIAVEITEGLLISDSPRVRSKLLDFKRKGIEVSIDDFGTGFSALSYLNQFDVDYLKIDRSFLASLEHEHSSKALVEAIIVMAHKLGIKTIAEGVETEAQRDLLIGLGCDYLQGYLYSRPVPADEFERLLERGFGALLQTDSHGSATLQTPL